VASAPRTSVHPLDPLEAAEVERAVALVRRRHGGELRFVSVTLAEPPKDDLLARGPGVELPRRAEVVVLAPAEQTAYEALVDLNAGEVADWRRLDGLQPALVPEEYAEAERLLRAHPDLRAALERRGIRDLELVCVDPVPAGSWGDHAFDGRRLCRALAWLRPYPGGNSYARPIEGVVGLVDLHRGEVLEVRDYGAVALPAGMGEYRAAFRTMRDDVKPIEITQPEGPSFEVDGYLVRWQSWSFRIGFTAREGLVLHQLAYDGRPILFRGSYSEMAVPYGDPSETRYLHSPFDIGENLIGTLVNSLELGCDCVGEIRYFDATVCNSAGDAVEIRNAICLHEEDDGILWKHYDFRTGGSETRRARRLVISSISTVGNYDYGFFWYLGQDGSIASEVKATGILATAAVAPGEKPAFGRLVAEGVNGMIHQHFFNVRLDLDVDGRRNSVYEVHTEPAESAYGNAFRPVQTLLRAEDESPALIDPLRGRHWLVVNPDSRNTVGEPVGYALVPGENVLPFAAAGSALERRAGFAFKHVWVTPYAPAERYAAGDYPNQSPGPDGLPRWIEAGRCIEGEDVVLWYTFGLHHLPRPEDWPVMPVHRLGFQLKPVGFFDENPALDVPPSHAAHCRRED
jgi:primary-amine oxidase